MRRSTSGNRASARAWLRGRTMALVGLAGMTVLGGSLMATLGASAAAASTAAHAALSGTGNVHALSASTSSSKNTPTGELSIARPATHHPLGVVPYIRPGVAPTSVAPNAAPGATTSYPCNTTLLFTSGCPGPLVYTTKNQAMVQTGGTIGKVTVYAVYWKPTTYATPFPTTYTTAIDTYLRNVAAASTKSSNVFSVLQQYYTAIGGPKRHIHYTVTYGGTFTMTTSFPATGCTAAATHSKCLKTTQEQTQLKTYLGAHPHVEGNGDIYVVYFPPKVETCFDNGTTCSIAGGYCGYHSATFTTTQNQNILYANMPYPPTTGCSTYPESLTGTSHATTMISVTSHELNETVTDSSTQWRTSTGNEIGDVCAYVWGTPLGGTENAGTAWNQTIDGTHYFTQLEYSDENYKLTGNNNGCIGHAQLPTAAITVTTPASTISANSLVTFTGTATNPTTTSLTYTWTWGDGSARGTTDKASHTFTSAGTYTVTLKVTDADMWSKTATKTVTVKATTPTATKLAFTTEPPAMVPSGATMTVKVSIESATGTVLTKTTAVTLAIKTGTGTAGAALTCLTNPSTAGAGVASFACKINKTGTGYQLTATSGALTSATSTAFTVGSTTVSKLVVTTPPTTVAGTTFTVTASIENASTMVITTKTTMVKLAVKTGTGTLTCPGAATDKKAAVKGVATFSCHITTPGTYILTASDTTNGTAPPTTTGTFKIQNTTTPTKLAVTTPGSTRANHTFTVTVTIQNGKGQKTNAAKTVTLAKATGTGTLSCTGGTTKKSATGVAAFTCKINKPGTGYKLTATSATLTSATTNTFTITTTTTAAKLAVTTEPVNSVINQAFSVGVSIENATDTVLTTKTTSVTLKIKTGTGTAAAVLTCTGGLSKAAVTGVATLSCSISKAGTNYVLTATSGALSTTTSAFTITATTGGGGGGTVIPSAPGGVKATAGTAQVTLTWQPVTGATSYAVYVSTKKGGENTGGPTACTVTAPGHACTVKNLQNGTTYYFVVVTREGGASSTPSAEVSATPASALPAPANVTAIVPGSTQINVVWSPVTGATGYDVFVATSAGKENLTGTPACTVTAPTDHCSLTGLSPATTYYLVVVALQGTARSAASKEVSVTTATKTAAPGAYRFVASDGGIFTFGGAGFYGSEGTKHLNQPIVGMAQTPTGGGYWLVASDGGIFTFGNAKFLGSEGTHHLNAPIVGMAATPTGGGYWLVASDGGIFTFGNAKFLGSEGTHHLNAPIVGMAATPTGGGYWLVASDGGIFTFGNAKFLGSEGTHHLNQPIVGMAATPTGGGYWLVASDGGIFTFGNAKFLGSEGTHHLNQPIVGMAATPTGGGYWLVASDGGIFTFGNAAFSGSEGATHLNQPIVGMAA